MLTNAKGVKKFDSNSIYRGSNHEKSFIVPEKSLELWGVQIMGVIESLLYLV